jgi:hypothetical protein
MATPYVSRSGRVIKKPVLYEPTERPEDDFKEDEYDEDDPDGEDDDFDDEEDDEDDEEDADDNGNLKGFVVEDEEDESDCD